MCKKCDKKVLGLMILEAEAKLNKLFSHLTDEHIKDPYYQYELRNLTETLEKTLLKIDIKDRSL